VWLYRPVEHKVEHHGIERVVCLGPRAQEVVKRFLKPNTAAYLFSPADAEAARRKAQDQTRKTPRYPSHMAKRAADPVAAIGDRYDHATLRRAIHRACAKAGIEPWNPNQIRHLAGTAIRKQFGMEAAQETLGHKHASTTAIYAEPDLEKAKNVARAMG
jgi:integrase